MENQPCFWRFYDDPLLIKSHKAFLRYVSINFAEALYITTLLRKGSKNRTPLRHHVGKVSGVIRAGKAVSAFQNFRHMKSSRKFKTVEKN
jgi:hypothetical protein